MLIAIIGATGFLGSHLLRFLSQDYDVIGTYFSKQKSGLIRLDLTNRVSVRKFAKQYNPEIVVHCAGLTKTDVCEVNKDVANILNVKGTQNLVQNINSKIIYFSTDYVFDGEKGGYIEEDKPNPINFYGITKLRAERIVLAADSDNLVLRVSGLYGFNPDNNAFIDSLRWHKELKQAIDCISSPTFIDDIAKNLPNFFNKSGIYHFSGPTAISRYDFTLSAVNLLGLPTKIFPDKMENIYHIAKRPRNSSLLSARHKIRMATPLEGLKRTRQQLEWQKTFNVQM